MQKHKYDIDDTNLMTILTFVLIRAGAWAGLRGAYQGIRQIFAFFNQKNVLSTSPKLYISISIFSSNEDSSYFQAQLHALSLFLGSLLPQVENNCILVYQYIEWYINILIGILCYVPVFQCITLWMKSIDPGFFDSLESSLLCSLYICSFSAMNQQNSVWANLPLVRLSLQR